jgi:hypothetical protein
MNLLRNLVRIHIAFSCLSALAAIDPQSYLAKAKAEFSDKVSAIQLAPGCESHLKYKSRFFDSIARNLPQTSRERISNTLRAEAAAKNAAIANERKVKMEQLDLIKPDLDSRTNPPDDYQGFLQYLLDDAIKIAQRDMVDEAKLRLTGLSDSIEVNSANAFLTFIVRNRRIASNDSQANALKLALKALLTPPVIEALGNELVIENAQRAFVGLRKNSDLYEIIEPSLKIRWPGINFLTLPEGEN